MARVALVTGGTRGIGAAIAKALEGRRPQGRRHLCRQPRRPRPSSGETGIAVFQWDVGDEAACAEGVKRVEAEVGPVDILVNNAGITRDGWFHKMDYDAWSAVMRTNLDSMFTMTRPVIEGMRDRELRPHRQHLLDQRPEGPDRPGQLFGRQGRHDRLHQGAGAGERPQGHHGELRLPRLHRHRHGGRRAGEGAGGDRRARSRSAGSARPRRSPRSSSISPRSSPPS